MKYRRLNEHEVVKKGDYIISKKQLQPPHHEQEFMIPVSKVGIIKIGHVISNNDKSNCYRPI